MRLDDKRVLIGDEVSGAAAASMFCLCAGGRLTQAVSAQHCRSIDVVCTRQPQHNDRHNRGCEVQTPLDSPHQPSRQRNGQECRSAGVQEGRRCTQRDTAGAEVCWRGWKW